MPAPKKTSASAAGKTKMTANAAPHDNVPHNTFPVPRLDSSADIGNGVDVDGFSDESADDEAYLRAYESDSYQEDSTADMEYCFEHLQDAMRAADAQLAELKATLPSSGRATGLDAERNADNQELARLLGPDMAAAIMPTGAWYERYEFYDLSYTEYAGMARRLRGELKAARKEIAQLSKVSKKKKKDTGEGSANAKAGATPAGKKKAVGSKKGMAGAGSGGKNRAAESTKGKAGVRSGVKQKARNASGNKVMEATEDVLKPRGAGVRKSKAIKTGRKMDK